jgi:hypothetical protein
MNSPRFTSDLERDQARVARRLLDGLLAGSADDVRSLYEGPADLDDPAAGRQIDGGFEQLVRNWAPNTLGRVTSSSLIASTTGADGRFAGTEFHLEIDLAGRPQTLDVVIVSEFGEGAGLVRNRLYYRLARLTGEQHARTRILPETPVRDEPDLPGMVDYQRTLRAGDAPAMAATFTADAVFDGHGESKDLRNGIGMGRFVGHQAILGVLTQMFEIGDEEAIHSGEGHNGTILEKLNKFNNGTTTVVEFNIIHKNHPTNRVSAGVAAYELDETGTKLKAARIYDEAW